MTDAADPLVAADAFRAALEDGSMTKERILTWEAKREFVEPDITPLPS
ncbi:MAG: hypothetical protein ACYTDX_07850 [Planctomycetota bacterium]